MANAKVELLFRRYPWLRSIDDLAPKAITHTIMTLEASLLEERVGRVHDGKYAHDARGYFVGSDGSLLGNIHKNVQGMKGWLRYAASCLFCADDVSQTRTVLEAARNYIYPDLIRFVVIVRQMHHLREYIVIEVFKLSADKMMSDLLPERRPRVYSELKEPRGAKSRLGSMLTD